MIRECEPSESDVLRYRFPRALEAAGDASANERRKIWTDGASLFASWGDVTDPDATVVWAWWTGDNWEDCEPPEGM